MAFFHLKLKDDGMGAWGGENGITGVKSEILPVIPIGYRGRAIPASVRDC